MLDRITTIAWDIAASWLTYVNGITYTWDANGNLLSDGSIESLKEMKPLRRRKLQWSQVILRLSDSGACRPDTSRLPVTDYTFSGIYASPPTEDYALYSIVHEVGHVWDRRTSLRLSNGLALYMGTLVCNGMGGCRFELSRKEHPPGQIKNPYAGINAMEDWAESFASTIYPNYYGSMNSKYYYPIGALRQKYVRDQIKAIR